MIEALRWEPAFAFLVLLVAGHLVGDALPRPRARAPRPSPGRVGVHAVVVTAVHLLFVLPLLNLHVLAAVAALGVLHASIDAAKARLARDRRSTAAVAVDQVLHLVGIGGVWWLVVAVGTLSSPRLLPEWWGVWLDGAVVAAAFALNAAGGSLGVRLVLSQLDPLPEERAASATAGAGHVIGVLERTITLILILAGQWAAMALLATAKSVARFDDLKDRRFAEYYLVGTLTSLLVAIVTGLGLRALGI